MLVKELIKLLQDCDPEYTVAFIEPYDDREIHEIDTANDNLIVNTVILQA